MHTVRAYQPEDLIAVLDCWEAASRQAHPFLSDAQIADQRRQVEEIYLPNTQSWVVLNNDTIAGFIGLILSEDANTAVEVGGFFVLPQQQGKGFGRTLMNHAAQLHGALELEVFEANTIGRGFYEAYGFTPISNSVHKETGNTLLRMRFNA